MTDPWDHVLHGVGASANSERRRTESLAQRTDVLYLHVGDPASAVDLDASEEGHHLRYDAAGQVVGLTMGNARWLLERDREIVVTPPALHLGAAELAPALAGAA